MVEITGKYTKRLAEFAAGLTFDDIPPEVVAHVKRIVLNQFSATLSGWHIDSGRQVHRVLLGLGGREEASVLGATERLPAPMAAAINATLAWGSQNDDTHNEGLVHSGHASVQPALAEGEVHHSTGRDFITAIVAANEVGIRIGRAVAPEQNQKYNASILGWWAELRGAFCAAVAGARTLGLNAERTAHALGIAATSTSGLYCTGESTPHCGTVYPWDAGKAVLMGLFAARLAASGMTDGPAPLEDEKGWVRTYTWGHGRFECLTEGLGEVFETGRITLKTRCASTMVHLPIDAAYALVKENSITPDQVDSIGIRGQQWLRDYMWRLDVASYQDAVYSLPYAISLVILEPAPMTYPDQVVRYLGDPTMKSLLSRCHLEVDPSMPLATQMPATVTIKTKDGRVFVQASGRVARGNYPENPLPPAELVEKFRRSGVGILPEHKVERAIELVDRLESLERINELARVMRREEG